MMVIAAVWVNELLPFRRISNWNFAIPETQWLADSKLAQSISTVFDTAKRHKCLYHDIDVT